MVTRILHLFRDEDGGIRPEATLMIAVLTVGTVGGIIGLAENLSRFIIH